jgi:hypothetical protein
MEIFEKELKKNGADEIFFFSMLRWSSPCKLVS